MAKKRSSLSSGRDISNISNPLDGLPRELGVLGHPMPYESERRVRDLSLDARRYAPVPPIARTLSGRPARVIATPLKAKRVLRTLTRPHSVLAESLSYAYPKNVALCVRRGVRKEVLHAMGIAGKRGLKGKGGSYKRRPSSQIRC